MEDNSLLGKKSESKSKKSLMCKIREGRCFGSFACLLEENAETIFLKPEECPAMKPCAANAGILIGKGVKVFEETH
jgi:hypothetical protein